MARRPGVALSGPSRLTVGVCYLKSVRTPPRHAGTPG